MKLIVGLGNPGTKYDGTRHNVGFEVIDRCQEKLNIDLTQSKHKGIYGSAGMGTEKIFLLKPLTYMNLSGESVAPLMNFYKMTPEDILVVYDDLDLAPGKIRLRQKGGAGGHNGIKSLIQHLGTDQFKRIRIGVGRPDHGQAVTDHVLGRFSPDDRKLIDEAVEKATDACGAWTKEPFNQVMNEFNK
ncbi:MULTISPECIES: aminoacyl-tRNA hydrolase [Alteribacter]|uniref:Peptidyl-tRNA hydrolase n=1 Tax=Alteribacter keqinensis TaxID=2483800 RepID=A0A3M7TPA6_9BACI|nr:MULTISPECIES: aminoacyl-tRNA hydrolase [Alteribacter]MBM7097939.1 aminoacyl-tRNA hydrolase [Alteribacter salitolerans]RNA66071.1 aminoacyl-tRNA hydrolase [Alteribacter keqinensis]